MTDIVDIYLETGDFHEAVKQSGLPTSIERLCSIKERWIVLTKKGA